MLCHPNKELCGAKGKVVGYADKGKVKVRFEQPPRYNNKQTEDIIRILSTKADIFFSLRFAGEIIGSKFDQLSTILGSINVSMPRDSKLPPSIDIGLNFMSRKDLKIVPNLVRVNFHYDKERKKDNPFKYIELSYRALEIIMEYKTRFPEIFKFMAERHYELVERAKETQNKIEWDEAIFASDIYKDQPAKRLMTVYRWLIEKEETHMPASSVFSKQVQLNRI